MPIALRQHGRPELPVVKLRAIELRGTQDLTMLSSADHNRVAQHAATEVHPWDLHALPEVPLPLLRAEALQAAVDALVLVRASHHEHAVEAVHGLRCRSNLHHALPQRLPLACSRIVPLNCLQPLAGRAAQDPQLPRVDRGGRGGACDRHGLKGHPVLHPWIVGLHVVQHVRAVEAAKSVDAAVQLRRCTVPAGHVEVGACHPLVAEAVEALRLAERLVVQVLAAEQVHPGAQYFCAKIRSLGAHTRARPPALVLHIQHLDGVEVVGAVVPADGVDQREREEADAQVVGLLAERVALRGVAGRRRRRGLPEEVQDASEQARVPIQENAPVAVSWRLRTASEQPLEKAPRLLHQCVPCGLKDHTADVDVDHRLRSDVVLGHAEPLLLVGLELGTELLPLEHEAPAPVQDISVDRVLVVLQLEASILPLLLDLPVRRVCLHLRSSPVIADPVVLCLLLGDELLPHAGLLLLECLALLLQAGRLVLQRLLGLLDPLQEVLANVAHHGAELILRG
mmetsp:Transcript_96546/g.270232  ORF Transcript_96546/g.270232 Transcript_96546/m.270232 type:complete len:511 (-) Transcript_96546:332-1864(-)